MPRLFPRTLPRRRRQPVQNLAASLPADVERLEKREVMTAMAAPVITSPGPVADDATPTITWGMENLSAEDLEKSQYEWRYEVMLYDAASGQQIYQHWGLQGRKPYYEGDKNARDGRQFTLHPNHLLETGGQYQFFVRVRGSANAWAKLDFTVDPKAEYVPPQQNIEGIWSGTTRPTIRWVKTANTKWYEISLRETTPGHEREVAAGRVHTHEYQLVNELTPGHSYEVRVRSASNDAYGQWSDAFEFDVDASAKSVSGVPTVLGPTGDIDEAKPTLPLELDGTHNRYFEIQIYNADGGTRVYRSHRGTRSDTPEFELPELGRGVNYQLYVRAISSTHPNAEIGQWAVTNFRVNEPAPEPEPTPEPEPQPAPTITNPSAVPILTAEHRTAPGESIVNAVPEVTGPQGETGSRPTIAWNAVEGIGEYRLMLYRNGMRILADGQPVRGRDADIAVRNTSFQPSVDWAAGAYTVHVGSVTANGNVIWSAGHNFTVTQQAVPAAPPATPSPEFAGGSANISWNAVSGAARYELLAYNKEAGRQVAHETNLTGTSFSTGGWDAATHQVFLRAINADGAAGQWSSPLEFAVTSPAEQRSALPIPLLMPVQPMRLSGPTGATLERRPTLEWNAATGERYELIGYDVKAGRQVVHETSLSTASYRPETLNAGDYQFFVRRIDSTGKAGSWSNALEFTVEQDQPVRALTETRVVETSLVETRAAESTLTASRSIVSTTQLRAVDATFADFSRI